MDVIKQMPKLRQSNFELLRIVSMMLVLLCHYVPTRELGIITSSSFALVDGWSENLIVLANLGMRSLSIVCVHCFILISGWFGIKFKIKSLTNLLFQMLFWCIACIAIAIIITGDLSPLPSVKTFFSTIVYGWFPESYLILFFVSPILNAFINSCNEKELGRYIIYFYILSTIGGYLLGWYEYKAGMSALSLCGLYLIGAYLKRSSLKIFSLQAKYDMMIYLGLGFMMVVLNLVLLRIGISSSPYGYLNPIVILMAIYLFLFFKKLEIKHNKIINFFSASAFSVYLFHCNIYLGDKISGMWRDINLHFGVFSSILVAIVSFVLIYLFCTMIDQIRIWVYNRWVVKWNI